MTVNEQIDRLNNLVKSALTGSFNVKPDINDFDEDFKGLFENVNELIENQKNFEAEAQVASSQIISASEDLALTLEENNKLMGELFDGSKNISLLNDKSYSITSEAIEGIKSIVSDIDTVRKCSEDAITVGEEAEKAVEDGKARVKSIVEIVDALESGSRKTVGFVGKFTESTKQISNILKVVHDISRETEILSFNASIESKRAGVEGRGFGVIAASIRDLAEKSRTQVTEIGDVIENISRNLKELTGDINEDFENAKKSAEHTKSLADNLSNISDTFASVKDRVGSIMEASKSQNMIAANMNEKISAVEENSELVKTGFDNVYRDIRNQKVSMDGLNNLGQYLLSSANEMSGIIKDAGFGETFDKAKIKEISDKVFGILQNEVLSDESFAALDPDLHKAMLDKLLSNDIIEAAWSNNAKGRFIYSNPPAGIKNARARDWFKGAVTGDKFTSKVYTSAITKKPCITVSMPIMNGGECVGVVGADLRLG